MNKYGRYNYCDRQKNALHVTNGAKVSVEDTKVSRNSSESTGGDNASFYGVGAAILAADGTAIVKDSEYTITVDNYNDTADLSEAGATDSWEDHAVERL